MNKVILLFAAAFFSINMQAAKALHRPVVITQSDGMELAVIGYGDEDFHYYTTADGVLLYHEGRDFYVASVGNDGNLSCTPQLAHEAAYRTVEEMELIARQDRTKFYESINANANAAKAKRQVGADNNSTLFPHTGTPKILVILAEFSDVPFTVSDPEKVFEQYLNADGTMEDIGNNDTKNYGSVAKYFKDMSFGNFIPQFDIYGPVTLSQPLSYYGGGNDYMQRLIPDACTAIDEEVNFADYDQNGDGIVDLVYIIYAGYSESWSGNSTDCIWPKSGTLQAGTYDGVQVYRYGVNNELNYYPSYSDGDTYVNGIGLFCHEFSHCMGMPDFYVTTAASEETQLADNQEMEYWSIMDSGTYLDDGYSPTAYTAWEREFFGWIEIETLTDAAAIELAPIDNDGKAYRILNDNDDTGNEYYIVENIQKEGWNHKQLGHGMLAIHVDYDDTKFSLSTNAVNNESGHPRMTVLAADGLLLNIQNVTSYSQFVAEPAGDPFPGTSKVYELTDETTVYPIIYTGTALNKPIYDIQENTETGVVTFKFLDRNATNVSETIVEKSGDTDNLIYTLDGRVAGTDKNGLGKGIYIIAGKKAVIK